MIRRILRRLRKQGSRDVVAPSVEERRPVPLEESEIDEEPEPDIEVDTPQFKAWLEDDQEVIVVDIRESHELRLGYADGALLIRMNDIPNRLDELPEKNTRLVVYCAAGMRSFGVTHWLREQGWSDAWSLTSGFPGAVEAGMTVTRPE
jgi:rhodanese-related sulfurtransferase